MFKIKHKSFYMLYAFCKFQTSLKFYTLKNRYKEWEQDKQLLRSYH